MKPTLTVSYPLRAGDFDQYGNLQPAGIMDLFQDIAGRHANELGIGLSHFSQKNFGWIISDLRYRIIQTPAMYTTVQVTTWPLPPSAVTCRREFCIKSQAGELLVVGTSQWAIMDVTKRKLVRAKEVYPEGLAFCTHLALEDKVPRLREFEPTQEQYTMQPGYSQLDCNGHVNNTKYANYILDGIRLQSHQAIKEFQIRYSKELLPYEPVTVFMKREGDTVHIMGKNQGCEVSFLGQVVLTDCCSKA